MPLVRIDLTASRPPDERRAIADAVHDALVAVLAIPASDRFQIITAHEPADIDVPAPVPVGTYSSGGWKASLFGDSHIYGIDLGFPSNS